MFEAKSIAATALRQQQTRLEVISNNVANVNTTAFKNARLDFQSAMYTTGLNPSFPRSPEEHNQKGHSVLIAGIGRDWRTGNFQRTERDLDFAIQGEGFFTLSDENGETVFTRNGSFAISAEEEGRFLVNGNGLYVLDPDGERIEIPFPIDRMDVLPTGELQFVLNGEIIGTAQLGMVTFTNIGGLEQSGQGLFRHVESAGEILAIAPDTLVRQGMLEGSNVNLAEEMTRLIRTQRAFQLASRALTTADEMEGIANTMRR
ncbi:MAG: flagellar hook-basal body protein [Oscillospiraceae bacterium]|nr:flagellar hook-basal body protein [Oscillospiraceae bacterium]MCL2278254.1 flagellar hook-basal body protein [Oscillospiraceae bacterium]